MEHCSTCGAMRERSARFCARCGQVFVPLPLPVPPPFSPGQPVPMAPGAPALNNVPVVQGTPGFSTVPAGTAATPPVPAPNLATGAPSAPPLAPSAAPRHPFAPHSFHPGAHPVGGHQPGQGVQKHRPQPQATPLAHAPQAPWNASPPTLPQRQHASGKGRRTSKRHVQQPHAATISRTVLGLTTKTLLIAIVGLVIVAAGASAFVLASRPHSQTPGPGGTPPADGVQNGTTATTAKTATTCVLQGDGPACPTSPTVSSLAPGVFIVTGQMAGTFTAQQYADCNQIQKATHGNMLLTVMNGTLNGAPYQLGFFLPYLGPGVYHQAGQNTTTVFLVSRSKSSTGLTNQGKLSLTITIASNGKGGSVDADLGSLDFGVPTLGHVTGQYVCV